MISTTIWNFPNAPPRREDTPPPRNRSKNPATRRPSINPKHTFETGRQTTPIRSSHKQKRVAEPCSLQHPFSAPHVDFFLRRRKKSRRVCEVRNFAYFCNSNTPKKEHQSRLSVAKLVAKNFRTAIFLRGNRLKINNKILSLLHRGRLFP